MADRKFAHLHLHTHYSLLDGANRIPELVAQTKKLGMNAVAITDHGNLYGAIEFYRECKAGGINPVIGYEAYLAPGDRREKKASRQGEAYTHLTLLAKNTVGFKNLIKLSSIAFLEGFYYHPRIDREILEAHKEGLICLSGCLAGEFNQLILKDQSNEAAKLAKWFHKLFKNDFYIEIQNNGIDLQDQCTPVAADIADQLGVPLVATSDAHYLCSEDAEAHDVLFCINTGKKRDPRKKQYPEGKLPNPYYVRSPGDMYKLFADYPDAVARSQEIADTVDIQVDLKTRHFPVFTPPKGLTAEEHLRQLCRDGTRDRYGDDPRPEVWKRLDHELGIICRMGFAGYFLIVWDFVRFAREKGIPCSARGSGCGSVVSYVLFMSHVDPLEYDLLFERFLDPNRSEAPDIDIDFCQERREQVIQYVKEKYGAESVAQIGTFGTLAAKAAIKDVGRVLDVPLERVNFLCKLVPMKGAISLGLDDAMRNPDFRKEYDTDPTIKQLVDIARKLEGMNRGVGTHAAGVVIANGPITDYVPVQRATRKGGDGEKGSDAVVTTQWEMGDIEKVGLLKMDFLGLRTLTLLDNAIKLIQKTRNVTIDVMKLPLDDAKTYELLQRGDAKGVFQFESEGIRELLKRMKPDNIRDIVACTALYRPGPLEGGMVDEYIECKHGRKKPYYPHPLMEEILSETYAVMVYQEQVMRVLNRMGGIELSSAYACIKAISKKKEDIIDARKVDFIRGAEKQGMSTAVATEIFDMIVKFGGYGFNKCVVAETRIMDARTGEVTTVGDLFENRRPFAVHSLNEEGRLVSRPVKAVMWNGRKKVYRLTTQLGKAILATANHPFRTLNGWTNLGDLTVGDRIAAPRRCSISLGRTWPQHELIALGGLLSEGNTCHPTTLYFYGNNRIAIDDFVAAIEQFPDTVAKVYQRPNRKCLEVQANTGFDRKFKPKADRGSTATLALPKRSGAFLWAEKLEILGKKATAKRIPAVAFQLCDGDLELLIGRLWAGDGFIANETFKVPFYATSSPGLAEDLQCLLLRLGIATRIHSKQFAYRGELRPGYTVHVLGERGPETFLERVAPHCVGREAAVEILKEHLATTVRGLTNKDTIPSEVREWVNEERLGAGLTWIELEVQADVSMREFMGVGSANKQGFRRSTISKLARFFSSQRLARVSESDVFWDRIESIEPVGIRDTYDLTVDVDHNFVADGLIVHNSHSAAYAHVTYQTAYLKCYYPAEFMAALLSSEIDDGNKRDMLVDHIADARKMGVDVLPPDVNRGSPDFDVVNGKIVFGLTAIKGLGRGAAEEIVRARDAGRRFKDLFDFCERIDLRTVPKAAIEKMIKAGAMDCLEKNKRAAMVLALPRAAQAADDKAADKKRGQKNFFDAVEDDVALPGGGRFGLSEGLPDVEEWPELEKLKYEKEALDFYISSHPLAQFDDQLRRFRTHDAAQIGRGESGSEVRIGGMINEVVLKTTKTGKRFAIVRVEDFTGEVKCVLWSETYLRFKDDIAEDKILLLEGKAEWRDGTAEPDLIVERILTIEQAKKELTRGMVLRIAYSESDDQLRKFDGVAAVLKRSKGPCPVYLTVRDPAGRAAQLKLGTEFNVNPTAVPVEELEMLLGPGSVLFTGR